VAAATIRVQGLREVQRALKQCEGGLDKQMRAAGKAAAEPVAASAKDKIGRYRGASLGTIRPRASVRGAFVQQGARKVTGKRGDFGVLQMGLLIDALEEEREQALTIYESRIDQLVDAAF
jgi:hypothetical protein